MQNKLGFKIISPVEAAVIAGNAQILKIALEDWKLEDNIIMSDGRHILNYAIAKGDIEICKILLERGQLKRYLNLNREGIEKSMQLWFNLDGAIIAAVHSISSRYQANLKEFNLKYKPIEESSAFSE